VRSLHSNAAAWGSDPSLSFALGFAVVAACFEQRIKGGSDPGYEPAELAMKGAPQNTESPQVGRGASATDPAPREGMREAKLPKWAREIRRSVEERQRRIRPRGRKGLKRSRHNATKSPRLSSSDPAPRERKLEARPP